MPYQEDAAGVGRLREVTSRDFEELKTFAMIESGGGGLTQNNESSTTAVLLHAASASTELQSVYSSAAEVVGRNRGLCEQEVLVRGVRVDLYGPLCRVDEGQRLIAPRNR